MDEATVIRQKIDRLLDEIWHRYIARTELFRAWADAQGCDRPPRTNRPQIGRPLTREEQVKFLTWAEGIELGEAPPIVNCRCTMIPVVEGERADYVIHDEPMRLRQEDLIDGVDLLELERRIIEAAMKSVADYWLDELEAWADSVGDDEEDDD